MPVIQNLSGDLLFSRTFLRLSGFPYFCTLNAENKKCLQRENWATAERERRAILPVKPPPVSAGKAGQLNGGRTRNQQPLKTYRQTDRQRDTQRKERRTDRHRAWLLEERVQKQRKQNQNRKLSLISERRRCCSVSQHEQELWRCTANKNMQTDSMKSELSKNGIFLQNFALRLKLVRFGNNSNNFEKENI